MTIGNHQMKLQNDSPRFRVRTIHPAELTPEIVRAWADLEGGSLHFNAFLSPHFILPAIRRLTSDKNVLILLVESPSPSQLWGVGVFEINRPSLIWPLPYLTAYRPPHSYLNGLLIDSRNPREIITALYDHLSHPEFPYNYVDLNLHPECKITEETHSALAQTHPLQWQKTGTIRRAVLRPEAAGEEYLQTQLKSRYKDCMRLLRQLSKLGAVTWHYLTGEDVTGDTVERFLELEHKGWKAAEGSSLASSSSHTAFFREMVEGFQSQHRVFFTELRLDGRAIASTCNLISGKAGFGFKIGWDPEYTRYSPGILNAFQLILHAPTYCKSMEMIDSCSSPQSFINNLWLEQRSLVTSAYTSSFLGNCSMKAHKRTHRVMRTINKMGSWVSGR
ncbi:MAG: GNAT family N-acetyltransferase [Nitrospira sp.]|nr:MAG: GNAT family N-acetyltransferase [Nitrospira sp.]